MQTVTDQGIVNYPLPYYMTGVMRKGPKSQFSESDVKVCEFERQNRGR